MKGLIQLLVTLLKKTSIIGIDRLSKIKLLNKNKEKLALFLFYEKTNFKKNSHT